MTLLITRPHDDAQPLLEILAGHQIKALIDPMLDIVLSPGLPLDLSGVQALLMTSANGVRAFAGRNGERDLPLFAVGDATAREAEMAGFSSIFVAEGDVQALASLVKNRLSPGGGRLLHVAGTRLAGDLAGDVQAGGFHYRREVLYEAKAAQSLLPETLSALKQGELTGVLLYSPRTAGIFCSCVRKAGCEESLNRITAYCLSPAVAEAARGLVWGYIKVADRPTQAALLECVVNSV